jgi:hypothetical protein
MFTVDGYIQGIAYHVVVAGGTDGVTPGRVAGCAVTDPATAAWLDEQAGQPFKVTPTGPSGITDLADPASVLGTLYGLTDVARVDGDAPVLLDPAEPGAVY